MGATIFRNATLHVTSEEFAGVDCFAVQDHRIIPMDPVLLEDGTSEEINLNGMHVAPGFIDLLVNGCAGVSFTNEPSLDTLEAMRRFLTQRGTTTFVPTIISSPRENLTKALAAVAEFKQQHENICPGLHMEGPFINSLHKGFHPIGYVRSMSESDLNYIRENRDIIAYITIAPEVAKPKNIVAMLSDHVRLSLGHTACSYMEAYNSFRAGVSNVTHIYNGMKTMVGREPGVIGALYASPNVFASVIPDGKHVHPAIIKLAHQLLGERLYIVSDSQIVTGMDRAPGSFAISGTEVFVDQKRGLIDSKGALAGTGITMMDGVRFLVERCSFTLDEALTAASWTPARMLELNETGRIAGGYIADLVIFDDDYRIRYVLQNGFMKNIGEIL
ncbi:MAG: N-acetylglucosamine-6-phosphate deacetylase [Succinivibrio sp.]|nr:N-acetylglucosamine-6-phosphate deacetylase [Succinivibrio sp.]